jgi:hypothetical protein
MGIQVEFIFYWKNGFNFHSQSAVFKNYDNGKFTNKFLSDKYGP